MTSLLIYRFAV